MIGEVDRRRSLEEIEGERWGAPEQPTTRLVAEAHRLRTVPVGELTVEDLRLLILQKIGLGVLVELAVEQLAGDPLAEGDLYPGDLLVAVLRVPAGFWASRPELRRRLVSVVAGAVGELPEVVARPAAEFMAQ